jgi:DNA-binding CsgD family transcriptional regulator
VSRASAYELRDRLSPTETLVLLHAGEGLTATETAAAMKRSPETVKTHRQHVLKKLEARNIAHAFAIAYRAGLVE